MVAKNDDENDFSQKVLYDSAYTLRVKNSVKIAHPFQKPVFVHVTSLIGHQSLPHEFLLYTNKRPTNSTIWLPISKGPMNFCGLKGLHSLQKKNS